MNWMGFVLDFAELTVWPFTLVMTLLILRKPLNLLLPFAQSIKYKDFELQFCQDLNAVSEQASEALPALQTFKPIELSTEQGLLKNAQFLPNHSILEAWSVLEKQSELLLLSKLPNINIPTQTRYKFIGQNLLENNIISAKQAKLFHELRQLRNKVAHAHNYQVNTVLALQYIKLCFAMKNSLTQKVPVSHTAQMAR